MSVKELMTPAVVTIDDEASCREAVAVMCRHKVRHLPVVSRQGLLCGIVTDRDLRHHLFRPDVFREIGSVSAEKLLAAAPVRQVMSSPVISIAPGASLEEAAGRMREDKLGSLPVVEGGRIVGILTETDLLRSIVGTDTGAYDVDAIVVSYP
jgi:acetoin utilization protein AcuB